MRTHRSVPSVRFCRSAALRIARVAPFALAALAGCAREPLQEAEETARAYLAPRGSSFAIASVTLDEVDVGHVRVRQTAGGVPVWGGEAIVHVKNGAVVDVTDDFVENAVAAPRAARLSREDAVRAAAATTPCPTCLTAPAEADLWLYRHEGQDRLAWRVRLPRIDGTAETAIPVVFVDAEDGSRLWGYDDLQTGSGTSLYSGKVTIGTFAKSSTHYLEDHARNLGTYTAKGSDTSRLRMSDKDDVWSSAAERPAVDAQFGAAAVMDYYLKVHGRHGIDGAGGPAATTSVDGKTPLVTSVVHYGQDYDNAFWDGTAMNYGDGDGTTLGPLVALDICGHEMTHGVTQHSAALVYQGESGALNESWSDVMGAMIERSVRGESAATWMIGEDAYTPGKAGDALRYMADPRRAGDPDNYADRYKGSEDNGGVHTNSTISSHAFYLAAHGGTHRLGGSVTGIGADAAQRIWYRALTSYMTSRTTFAGARKATLAAASALYGASSTQVTAVAKAWSLVGVN